MRKEAEAYKNAIAASEKSLLEMQTIFSKIGGELFNLSVSDFFVEIERSPELMKKLQDEVKILTKELTIAANGVDEAFADEKLKGKSSFEVLLKQVKKLEMEFPVAAKIMIEELESVQKAGLPIQKFKFSKVFEKAGLEASELGEAMLKGTASAQKFDASIQNFGQNTLKIVELKKELQKTTTETLSLSKAFGSFIEKSFSIEKIIGTMTDFDKTIVQGQKDFGIELVENSSQITNMAVEGARFGQTTESMTKFMGQLGNTLNTTNFDLLKKAAVDTQAIAAATGLSNEEVGNLTGQFMLLGQSSGEVKKFAEQTSIESKKFGLNTKKVLEDISKNISKFRQMGFQGGEDSLKRMVMTAQRLRMNVDEIFNVDEKARTIEGALEMAADLQLAGGSFAKIDPMQLLSAARKGPEELTKILGEMGQDVGGWVKDMKGNSKYEFDPVDHDRLEAVAKATGLTIESLQNQIVKGAERVKKEGAGLFSNMGGMTEDQKNMVDQMTSLGKDGKTIEFSGAFKNFDQEKFAHLTQQEIQAKLQGYEKDKDDLEEQAKQNTALTDAFKNLTTSFLNVFTGFEPFIRILTTALNFLNSAPPWVKEIIAGIGLLLLAFKSSLMVKGALQGGNGIMGIAGKMFNMGKSPAATAGDLAKDAAPMGEAKGATIEQNLTGIANGIKAFASTKVLLGAAAMLLVAPALALMTLGLPFLAGIALIGTAAGVGLQAFGVSLGIFGETVSAAAVPIIIGEALLAGFGAALIPFGIALSKLSPLVDSFGKIIIGVFSAIPSIISAIADGIVTVSKGFMDMATSLIPLAPGLYVLAPALIAAALGFSALFLSFANPIATIGMGLMIMTLSSLNNIMTTLTPSLELGATGINSMADGVKNLSTALSTINTDTLDSLKHFAEVMTVTNAINNLTGAVGNLIGGRTKGGEVQKFEFTVIVKNESGREIQRKIIKDTDLMT